MKSHEIDYEILGDDMQIVEVELDPGETVIAEAGAMNYMDDGIAFEAKMGDGSAMNESLADKLFNVGKRVLTGESIFSRLRPIAVPAGSDHCVVSDKHRPKRPSGD